jgi:hypothetical protein
MGEIRNVCKILTGKKLRSKHLEDQGADGRIILMWLSYLG